MRNCPMRTVLGITGLIVIVCFGTARLAWADAASIAYDEGRKLAEGGRLQDAIGALDKAIRLKPDYAQAYSARGSVYGALAQYEKAVQDFNEAVRLNPRYLEALYNRGNVHSDFGRYDLAVQDYNEAIRLNPSYAEAFYNRALAYLYMGRVEAGTDARSYLQIKGWQDPQAPYIALIGSLGYRKGGQDAEAQRLLGEAATNGNSQAWPSPIIRYLRRELTPAALLAATANADQQTEARTYLGMDLAQSGNRDQALLHLQWVKDNGNKGFVEYRFALAELRHLQPGEPSAPAPATSDRASVLASPPPPPPQQLAASSVPPQYSAPPPPPVPAPPVASPPLPPPPQPSAAFQAPVPAPAAPQPGPLRVSRGIIAAPSSSAAPVQPATPVQPQRTPLAPQPNLAAVSAQPAALVQPQRTPLAPQPNLASVPVQPAAPIPSPSAGSSQAVEAYNQGVRAAQAAQWQAALAALSEAIRLDPRLAEAYYQRAFVYLSLGNAQAGPDATSFVQIKGWQDPQSPSVALLGYFGYQRGSRETEAQRLLNEAATNSNPATWPYPVIRYLRRELTPGALLATATNTDQQTEARTYLGMDLSRSGRREQALIHLRWVRERGNRETAAYQFAVTELRRLESGS